MNGCKSIAQRIVNAENKFIDEVVEQFNFTSEQAEKIMTVYRKFKIVKIDAVTGQFELKHGAFWDRIPMENALKEVI